VSHRETSVLSLYTLLSLPAKETPNKICAVVQLVVPPLSNPRVVDFGPPIRKVTAYLYNLPEVASTHECLGVPTVSARFATAPVFWNWAMLAVARLAPEGFLEDRDK
jgi:hypothetical protein